MKSFFRAIVFGILAITACAREVNAETTSVHVHKSTKTHAPTTTLVSKKKSTTTTASPMPTCDVRVFRIGCPEVPDPCCARLCLDATSGTLFCADEWEDVGDNSQCESCEPETTTSSDIAASTAVVFAATGVKNGNLTTTASIPEPTMNSETSEAHVVRIGGAAAFGILGLLFAI